MSPPTPGHPPQSEEPWETHVASALAGLPLVEPPDGFLARAVDHRPLHAGRTLAAWAAIAAAGLGLSLALGASEPAGEGAAASEAENVADADGFGSGLGTLRSPTFAEIGEGLVDFARQLGLHDPGR